MFVLLSPSLYIWRLVTREHSGVAMHLSPPHKGIRAFVNLCSSFPCALILRAHLCLYPLVHTARAVISKARRVVINESPRPHKMGQQDREIDWSSRKPQVFYVPSYSLFQDPRGPAQVTHTRETSRQRHHENDDSKLGASARNSLRS